MKDRHLPLPLRSIPDATFPVWRLASVGAGIYVLLGMAWISLASGSIGEGSSGSSAGEVLGASSAGWFLVVSGCLLFGILAAFGRQVQAQEEQITRQTEALARSEQAVLAGTFASAIAHDINNALTMAIAAAAEPEAAGSERDLAQAHHSIAELSQRLMELGAKFGQEESFEVVGKLKGFLRPALKQPVIRTRVMELEHDGPVWLHGDPTVLTRAVLNMVLNAAEATREGGRIEVSVRREERAVAVHVDDDGPGVPEERRREMFRSFHTTKPEGHGLGLMSMVACAQQYGGTAEVGDSMLGGARFTLRLPAEERVDRPVPAPPTPT